MITKLHMSMRFDCIWIKNIIFDVVKWACKSITRFINRFKIEKWRFLKFLLATLKMVLWRSFCSVWRPINIIFIKLLFCLQLLGFWAKKSKNRQFSDFFKFLRPLKSANDVQWPQTSQFYMFLFISITFIGILRLRFPKN